MGYFDNKYIPHISANVEKHFLEKKGYKLDFDFKDAKLGNYIKENYNPVSILRIPMNPAPNYDFIRRFVIGAKRRS